jgi:hypothetical protein
MKGFATATFSPLISQTVTPQWQSSGRSLTATLTLAACSFRRLSFSQGIGQSPVGRRNIEGPLGQYRAVRLSRASD